METVRLTSIFFAQNASVMSTCEYGTGAIDTLIIAGWTGRNREAVEHHIAELEAIGVKRPRTVPCFYRVGANLLTTAAAIDVVGPDSSGEVEFVLVSLSDDLYVAVG